MLIDTHCHLDYLKAHPLEEIFHLGQEAQVKAYITISVAPKNIQTVLDLSLRYTNVFCTQGIHPHEAKLATEDIFKTMKKNASNNQKVKAIGEIGLDYHYTHSPPPIQKEMFEKQLALAKELDLPVVIHTRKADEDTLAILKNMAPGLKKKGVLHSYTSGPKLADYALSEGFYLGFNGIITFKKPEEVKKTLQNTPLDQILFETDAPFLAPTPHRGQENSPHYLKEISKKASELLNQPEDDLRKIVFQNSIKLFDLPLDLEAL